MKIKENQAWQASQAASELASEATQAASVLGQRNVSKGRGKGAVNIVK